MGYYMIELILSIIVSIVGFSLLFPIIWAIVDYEIQVHKDTLALDRWKLEAQRRYELDRTIWGAQVPPPSKPQP